MVYTREMHAAVSIHFVNEKFRILIQIHWNMCPIDNNQGLI